MVKLVREPENMYDRNAIRVENIHGQKVGHLKREVAAQLAQLLDTDDLRIEGGAGAHASLVVVGMAYDTPCSQHQKSVSGVGAHGVSAHQGCERMLSV